MSAVLDHLNKALDAHRRGDLVKARAGYRRVLDKDPRNADAAYLIGLLNLQEGKLAQAFTHLRRAAELDPLRADAFYSLGKAHELSREWPAAEAHYRRALELNPGYRDAWLGLGIALRGRDAHESAENVAGEALKRFPDSPDFLVNRGSARVHQGKLDDALADFERAARLKPDFPEAHFNLGRLHRERGALDHAIAAYRRALELRPGWVEVEWNLGVALLMTGNFADGWRLHEARNNLPAGRVRAYLRDPQHQAKLWTGQPLDGQTVLVRWEQGFGDVIQFARFLPDLKARGAGRVILECQPSLLRLLDGCKGADQVIAGEENSDPDVAHDRMIPIMSLPYRLGIAPDDLPRHVPYLQVDAAEVERWRNRLGSFDGLTVGLVWQGNPAPDGLTTRSSRRAVPLELFKPLADMPGVRLVSLQKGHGIEQLAAAAWARDIPDLGAEVSDFADTGALVSALDLLLTIDTSINHVAGGLGRPVWMLCPFAPDWRWQLGRADSPWYPNLRLFRQTVPGEWAGPMAAVNEALRDRLSSSRP